MPGVKLHVPRGVSVQVMYTVQRALTLNQEMK